MAYLQIVQEKNFIDMNVGVRTHCAPAHACGERQKT